jgi:hypothetical protein
VLREALLSLVATFVIEPFHAEMDARLAAAGAPAPVLQAIAGCAQEAGPAAAQRAWSDWGWALSTAVELSLGRASPETLVSEVAPSCGPALTAARPFLEAAGG